MAEDVDEEDGALKKKSKLPMLIGTVLALVLGGGGFFAVYSGMILGPEDAQDAAADAHGDPHAEAMEDALPLPQVAFVPIDPLVINLGTGASSRHLRFRAQLEVTPQYQQDVTDVLPRVQDVLNSYLRAVSIDDLEDPTALIRLRAQMLRRIKIVTGEGRVRDLLIMEFVLN
ncbi:flagellar basal body-associated protein FliL [Pseudoruegeria sp. HB172150]|uniref:flagellar basal body-associated FliL family protein n=1 Tax=Pseudoruegeria sp. HB172150 TaxID=2721164 RepID=UPI001551ABF6|nr:flagellar basal body-associated FliL family protein [Pseudoruegeria sp. HB172150]